MIAALSALLLAGAADAVVIGDFETGLDGWTTTGDVLVTDASFGTTPTLGSNAIVLSTLPNNGFGTIPGTLSGVSAVTAATIDTFLSSLSVDTDTIHPNNLNAIEGSAILLTGLEVEAGDVLRFDFNFLTNETDNFAGQGFNDFFFSAITGVGNQVEVDAVSATLGNSSTIFDRETGFSTVAYTFLTAGIVDIAFGIVDVRDANAGSAVVIDNIHHVPEPGTALLFGVGLGALGLRRRCDPVR